MTDRRGATEEELRAFRRRFYGCLGRGVDALFELTDAMLTSGTIPSPVHLSLAVGYRRGWSSLYAALRHGAIDEEAVRVVLAHRMTIDEDGESYGTTFSPDGSTFFVNMQGDGLTFASWPSLPRRPRWRPTSPQSSPRRSA